jgi:hypothetical protein
MSFNDYEYVEIEFDSYDTNTSFDNNYTSDNWPLFRLGRPLSDICAMKVISAEIPFSYYVINTQNQNFSIKLVGGSTFTIAIPIGNYSGNSLVTILNANVNWPSFLVASYSSTTNKISIQNTSAVFTYYFIFGTSSLDNGSTNPRFAMGFAAGNSDDILPLTTFVAPFVVQISGPNYLYLNSTLYGQSFNLFLPEGANSNGLNGYQLCKIPVNTNAGGVIFYNDTTDYTWFEMEDINTFNQIDFFVTVGNVLGNIPTDFNGGNISLKMGLLIKRELKQLGNLTLENKRRRL